MPIKYTQKEVYDFIEGLGYILISLEYINAKSKLIIKDQETYLYFTSLDKLKQGKMPNKFDIHNPYTIQNIKLWCKLNNKLFELVSARYDGCGEKLKWKCLKKDCGEIFESSWDSILQGRGCGICEGLQVCLSNCLVTKNPELASEWHPILNGDITPYDVVIYSSKKVWWQCSKNPKHKWEATVSNRYGGSKCPYCSGKLPSEDYNLLIDNPELCKEWSYKKNNKRPEEYTPNSNVKVWWRCKKCGNEWKTSINVRNNGCGCPQCKQSKGEKIISIIFNKNNIYYFPQKTFDNLLGLGNGLLSYDFYLPEYNLLIEYQGEMHDRFVRGIHKSKNDFFKQQEHDKRKREHAQNNNIKLLEIWYWDFDNIESILSKELNLPTPTNNLEVVAI